MARRYHKEMMYRSIHRKRSGNNKRGRDLPRTTVTPTVYQSSLMKNGPVRSGFKTIKSGYNCYMIPPASVGTRLQLIGFRLIWDGITGAGAE